MQGVSSPAKAAYVVETVDAELRGASNGTRWAAFAIGSCVPLRIKHPEKKNTSIATLQRKSCVKWKTMAMSDSEWSWVTITQNEEKNMTFENLNVSHMNCYDSDYRNISWPYCPPTYISIGNWYF